MILTPRAHYALDIIYEDENILLIKQTGRNAFSAC